MDGGDGSVPVRVMGGEVAPEGCGGEAGGDDDGTAREERS